MVWLPRVTTKAPDAFWAPSMGGMKGAVRTNTARRIHLPTQRADGRWFTALTHSDRLHLIVLPDLVHDVHPLGDLSEHRVHTVQVGLGRVADEELTATGVLAGVGHGERSRHVLVRVALGLALDGVSLPPSADAAVAGLRLVVAALDHEVG